MLDVGSKGCPVLRPVEHHGDDGGFPRDGRHQGRRIPVPVGRVIHHALALLCPAEGARHIGLCARFVKKDQTMRIDPRQPFAPSLALLGYVLAALLART